LVGAMKPGQSGSSPPPAPRAGHAPGTASAPGAPPAAPQK
jgi:hypothetical protein